MTLSDFTDIGTGHPFRSKIKPVGGTGVFAVQLKDVSRWGEVVWRDVVETKPATVSPAWLADGDVLLAARGSQNRAVLITNPPRALAAPHWYVIRCRNNKLLPAFLVWQLNRKPAQSWFQRESAGTTTKNLRLESVAKLEIAVPPVKEQQRIIAIADAALRERQLCERLMTATEELNNGLARRLLQEPRPRKAS